MTVHDLRIKHPSFTYEDFNIRTEEKHIILRYTYTLEPAITFHSEITIPYAEKISLQEINIFAFHLGLIEALNYWKTSCAPHFIVKAGQLSTEQIYWWHDLFIHGLGEFYYRNTIDFTMPDFLTITSDSLASVYSISQSDNLKGALIMVSGGKDSIVTQEIVKNLPLEKNAFLVNPTQTALEAARIGGYTHPVIVKRSLDPQLLSLNNQGYLNGHVPFSAFLAFLGILTGVLHGYHDVIASNEYSAAEENVMYRGLPVNHQYSKGFRFESLFRTYIQKYVNPHINYFSFLRPLSELQIAKLFIPYISSYPFFCSCNLNKGESWCGTCPKCAFAYILLFPYLSQEQRLNLFGKELLENPSIQEYIRELVGLGDHKPFDCVGTIEESKITLAAVIYTLESQQKDVPEFLIKIKKELRLNTDSLSPLHNIIKQTWVNNHFLPSEYERLLKNTIISLPL